MRVTVEFFAQLRLLTGKASERLQLTPPCTAQDLVRRLAGQYGDDFRRLVIRDDGQLAPSVLVFVGEEQVLWSDPHWLADGDSLCIATPIAGG